MRPGQGPVSPAEMVNELGLPGIGFDVGDLQAAVDLLAAVGYGLVGGIGQFEHFLRMTYVREPEGIGPWPDALADATVEESSSRVPRMPAAVVRGQWIGAHR